jgi:ribosomal-protein-alanine N-acetyltransferase
MISFHFETERLLLREFRHEDADALFKLDSNPLVHRYLGNKPVQDIAHIHRVIDSVQLQYKQHGIARWIAVEKNSGNIIGWTGLKFCTEEENGHINYYDVGYRLMPEFWGKGYATESARFAIQYGFDTLHCPYIIGACNHENLASRRALEKCGLVYVEDFYWQDILCNWLIITEEKFRQS